MSCKQLFECLESRQLLSTFTVTNTNDSGAGSLRQAIVSANSAAGADVVVFNASLAGQTITLTSGEVPITSALTVTGPGANQLSISGNGSSRVFNINGSGAVAQLSGLRIRQGNAGGVGISNGAVVTITGCEITNSSNAGAGGGISVSSSTLTITNSVIANNITSGDGGGVFVLNGSMTMRNCTVAGNTAGGWGGGIGRWTNDASTFVTVTNSTITGNTANTGNTGTVGGGVYARHGTWTIVSTIIAENVNAGQARADDAASGAQDGLSVSNLANCTNNLIGDSATSGNMTNGVNGNIVGVSAMLLPLTLNGGTTRTVALLAGSPAIGKGLNPAGLANDQRGTLFARASGAIDIGAYESQALALTTDIATDESDWNFASGDLSLREAIEQTNANPGNDSIGFASGLAGSTLTLGGAQLTVSGDVNITGPGANRLSVSANNASAVMTVNSGVTAVISGLTITGGNTTVGGGITNNGTLSITACAISGNTASSFAGGIANAATGTLTITNSTISGNNGGNFSGAIDARGIVTITNSTISGNTAGDTGGILVGGNMGAAIFVLSNSTVTNNTDTQRTGGISVFAGSATLTSSIVAGNTKAGVANDVNGTLVASSSRNLIGSAAAAGGLTNGTNGNLVGIANALLGPLANNGGPTRTHALLAGSPALGAGSNALALTTDQRGAPFVRGYGTQPDIGAFESQPALLVVSAATDVNDGDFSAGNLSLREAIGIANGLLGADVITFAPSLTNATITLTGTALTISDDLTITGPGSDKLTVSAAGLSGIFIVNNAGAANTVNITGLKLTNGIAGTGTGGAIVNSETLNLTDVILTGNSVTGAGSGGAIANNSGATLSMTNSSVSGNSAQAGGGGGVLNAGTATLTDVTVSNNSVTDPTNAGSAKGGGVLNTGTLTVLRGSIINNTIVGSGSGVYNSGTANLTNVTVNSNIITDPNNVGTFLGGGIHNTSSLTVTGGAISGNVIIGNGGGVYNSGTATLQGVLMNQNQANDPNSLFIGAGGAIMNATGATLNVATSSLTLNSAATMGGGIENNGTATVTGSTIRGNTAAISGGGVDNFGGTFGLITSTVSGNSTQGSGGAFWTDTVLGIQQSTISGNSAADFGGGIGMFDGTVTMTNSTMAFNIAETNNDGIGQGGGIDVGKRVGAGTLALTSTIISNNTMVSATGAANDITLTNGSITVGSSNNLIGSAATAGGLSNGINLNLVGVDPRLAPLTNNGGPTQTHSLRSGSPAMNVGANPNAFGTDQRGYARVGGTAIDIGAFEARVYATTAGTGRLVYGAADSANAHRAVSVNSDGSVIVFEQGWTAVNLQEQTGAPSAISDAVIWVDPKDNLVYVAAPSSAGLILYSRTTGGVWSFRNLTTELNASSSPSSRLVYMISTNQVVVVGGFTSTGSLVAFRQTLQTATGGGPAFSFVDISAQLTQQSMQTPNYASMTTFVTNWNTWHFVGIDTGGQIQSVWLDPANFANWRADNLTVQYGAPAVMGQLAVTLTTWGGINLTGLDTTGHLRVTWWVPGSTWSNADLTVSAGGSSFAGGNITGYGTPWGGMNYIGVDNTGQVIGYWWAPANDRWFSGTFLPTGVPTSSRPTGSLTSYSSRAGTLNIFGTSSAGDAIRMWWQPGAAAWTVEDLTQLAVRS